MAPTSVLSGIVVVLADQRARAIFRGIPRGEFAGHFLDILAAGIIRFGSFFLAWLFGAFALAAVATVVNDLDADDKVGSWSRDSYEHAREHFGSLIALALITFCIFLAGLATLGLVEGAGFRLFGAARFLRYNYVFWIIGMIVVGSIVGWLGAAIPLVLRRDTKVWAALKKSVELSSGYEGSLLLLVVESVAGSVIVWYVVVHGLPLLLPPVLTYSLWYVWLLNLTGVLASAAVESPLFIGFSLLADPDRLMRRDFV